MATVDWVYPITSTISGTTYIKDTDDKIQSAMDDLTLWVNSGAGYLTTGLAQSMVDVTTAQTIAGAKSFTDPMVGTTGTFSGAISATTGTFTGQVTTITPVADTDAANKVYVDDAFESLGLSGTYTPTITAGVNTSSIIVYKAKYTRIGDIVTVFGAVKLSTTSDATSSSFYISLPVAMTSNFTDLNELSGTANSYNPSQNGVIYAATPSKKTAICRYTSVGTGAAIFYFSFSYLKD